MQYHELNYDRIQQKIADIRENLELLRGYAAKGEKAFLKNQEAIRSAKYAFIVLIEAAISIANHFCARLLGKAPVSYAEAYLLLGNEGILETELANRLAQMAKFRNLLVHGYDKVNDRKVYEILCNDLDDLELFLQSVYNVLNQQMK